MSQLLTLMDGLKSRAHVSGAHRTGMSPAAQAAARVLSGGRCVQQASNRHSSVPRRFALLLAAWLTGSSCALVVAARSSR